MLATALLGTEQRKCSVISPELEFLSARQELDHVADHEAWLLLAAAYAANYRRAGQIPPVDGRGSSFPAAQKEKQPYCSPALAARLASLLPEGMQTDPLTEELLAGLVRKQKLAPPHLLPTLLNWGQRSKERRALIAPVVGERGHWLASINPAWKNALHVDGADKKGSERSFGSQQTLYDLLGITDNIFSKTFTVFKENVLRGKGQHSRMLHLVMSKLLDFSRPGGTRYAEHELIRIAAAVPIYLLPELIHEIRLALSRGEYTWLARLGELLEFRHQMLEELAHE